MLIKNGLKPIIINYNDRERYFELLEEFKVNNKPSVYTSESFGNYSRSWATNSKGNVVTWKDVFKEDLNQYRCMFDDREGLEVIKWL